MKKYSKYLFVLIVSVLIMACTKVEKGPKGDPGAPGKSPGIESELVMINGSMWAASEDSLEYEVTLPTTKITQEIVDKGSVQMYVSLNGTWYSLPYFEVDDYTTFGYEVGKVHVLKGSSHHVLPDRPTAHQYKIVTLVTR